MTQCNAGRRGLRDFSPVARSKCGTSNTGQKAALSAPLIDWCTVVLDSAAARKYCRRRCLGQVLEELFAGAAIAVGVLQDVTRNYYPRSASLTDHTGTPAGFVAARDDRAIQIVLSGQGTQHVEDWTRTADRLDTLDGRLSRVDIAVDDLLGASINVHRFKALHAEGAFVSSGRPPSARFVDDMGSSKGCTLYIGQRGHKQLCVYEKGKQLGDATSPYARCEVRLYGKHFALSTDVLRAPRNYFAGAYPPLQALVDGERTRLDIKAARVQAHAKGMVRALRMQAGRSLGLLDEALGEHATAFLAKEVLRQGRPHRFRGVTGDLALLVRQQLTPKIPVTERPCNASQMGSGTDTGPAPKGDPLEILSPESEVPSCARE